MMASFLSTRAKKFRKRKGVALKTIFIKPIAIFHKKVYNILTTEQTGACIQAERKVYLRPRT